MFFKRKKEKEKLQTAREKLKEVLNPDDVINAVGTTIEKMCLVHVEIWAGVEAADDYMSFPTLPNFSWDDLISIVSDTYDYAKKNSGNADSLIKNTIKYLLYIGMAAGCDLMQGEKVTPSGLKDKYFTRARAGYHLEDLVYQRLGTSRLLKETRGKDELINQMTELYANVVFRLPDMLKDSAAVKMLDVMTIAFIIGYNIYFRDKKVIRGIKLSEDQEILNHLTEEKQQNMADEIFVINVGGYIGSSTRSEIEYAISTGKTVNYLEKI